MDQELARLAMHAKQLEATSGTPEIASRLGYKVSAVIRTRVATSTRTGSPALERMRNLRGPMANWPPMSTCEQPTHSDDPSAFLPFHDWTSPVTFFEPTYR